MDEKSAESFSGALQRELDQGLARVTARERCYLRISEEPSDLAARLILAKLYYLDSFVEFAIRELIEVRRRRPSPRIDALLRSFGSVVQQFSGSVTGVPFDSKTDTDGNRVDQGGIKLTSETRSNPAVPFEADTVGEIDFDLSIFDE